MLQPPPDALAKLFNQHAFLPATTRTDVDAIRRMKFQGTDTNIYGLSPEVNLTIVSLLQSYPADEIITFLKTVVNESDLILRQPSMTEYIDRDERDIRAATFKPPAAKASVSCPRCGSNRVAFKNTLQVGGRDEASKSVYLCQCKLEFTR